MTVASDAATRRRRGARPLPARRLVSALLLALIVGASGAASAQDLVVDIEAEPSAEPTVTEDGKPGPIPAPSFRAVVIGAIPGLAEKDFVLRQDDVDPPVELEADKVETYIDSDDRMALVVLVQGDERWMGNETYRDEEDLERLEGAFTGAGPALDAFANAGPAGSKAALLIYTRGKAEAKQSMGPAEQLGAASLGSQKDYERNIGIPLLVGLDESMNLFDNHADYRKILVVIGDGTGQEEDISAGLKDRISKLKQRGVEVFTIHYESIVSGSPVGQNNMRQLGYTGAKHATSRDNMGAFAKQFAEQIGARYYASFPGCDPKQTTTCFSHDGQQHAFMVVAGEAESEIIDVPTILWQKPVVEESSLWWLWLLIAIGVIAIIVVIVVLVGRRPPPAPMPMPVPDVPPAPDPGPQRTMMINANANDGGLPLVGWIVPLTGPNQYQTFKLLQGVTKIGSGPECNIVIQDTFMSHIHAEFICAPTGFVFKDGGSTNGSFVNDQRASTHELVDNDQLVLGKTTFKFKSIN